MQMMIPKTLICAAGQNNLIKGRETQEPSPIMQVIIVRQRENGKYLICNI